jgi:hypothetical protein
MELNFDAYFESSVQVGFHRVWNLIFGALDAMDAYRYQPSSSHNAPFWTNNQGSLIFNNKSSLTMGERGECINYSKNVSFMVSQFNNL